MTLAAILVSWPSSCTRDPTPLVESSPLHLTSSLPGDTCAAATLEVGTLPYVHSDTTAGRTDDYNLSAEPASCAGGGSQFGGTGIGPDLVYRITVDQTCDLQVRMQSVSADMNVTVVTDCADLDGSCLGVDDAGGGGAPEDVFFTAAAGTDYLIIVDGWNGNNGAFDLTITETTSTGCHLSPICDGTNDGASCVDGNACTDNDLCTSGVCQGTANDTLPCDDGNECTDDACVSGVCQGTNDDANTCSDGIACTQSDACSSGSCLGVDVNSPKCNSCRAATPEIGALPYVVSGDTTGAADTFNLAVEGTCAAGGWQYSDTGVGGDALYRLQVDQACDLNVQMVPASADMNVTVATDCGDIAGSCLGVDDAGSGGGAEDVAFTASPGADYFVIVDGWSGGEGAFTLTVTETSAVGCALVAAMCDGTNDGDPCDDNNPCTENDQCTAGACTGANNDALSCEDGDPCTDNTCSGGTCVTTNNTAACDDGDGNPCTTGACSAGACVATNDDTQPCDDGNECADDACVSGSCVGTPDDTNTCTDGFLCTNDACVSGTCQGTPKDCSTFDGLCLAGFCNPGTGFCEAGPGDEGATCDDGEPCTDPGTCTAGECATILKDCSSFDDGICVLGVCNTTSGACEAGTKDCSAFDQQCNPAVCNTTSGVCEPTPGNDGSACDDGDRCTINDTCSSGTCAGTPKSCNDTCNTGTCDSATGTCTMTPTNPGGSCVDGNPCTDSDACSAGTCIGTVNDSLSCDDGDPCTNDACVAGDCVGSAKDCSSLDSGCLQGSCNAATGLCEALTANEGGSCDDGEPCTKLDTCSAGACAGIPKDCSNFTDACNVGTCNPTSGACEADPITDGTACDDGEPCTTGDRCQGGLCVGDGTCPSDDGGPTGDTTVPITTDSTGCGCSVDQQGSGSVAWLSAVMAASLLVRRRRRAGEVR